MLALRRRTALAVLLAAATLPASIRGADRPRMPFYPEPSSTTMRIYAALQEKTDFQFTQTPLTDALGFLKDYHQVNLWIDVAALQAQGINPEKDVTLEISGITLRSGLKLLLEPQGLTFVVEDEILKVTTVEAATAHQLTRVYPVQDLASSPEELKSLSEAIEKGLAGVNWNKGENSKIGGTITPVLGTRALVIRQTYSAHEKVLELLDSLRAAVAATAAEAAAPGK
jgi:hypothetical protein